MNLRTVLASVTTRRPMDSDKEFKPWQKVLALLLVATLTGCMWLLSVYTGLAALKWLGFSH